MSTLPRPIVPTYSTELPVTKKTVKFRPFIVKEEKILLLAKQNESLDEVISAIIQILMMCTFEAVDIAKLPTADIEFLFIRIRERSIGETIEGEIDCKACGNKQPYFIQLENVKVENNNIANIIQLDDSTILTMKYPTITAMKGIQSLAISDIPMHIVAGMIESITVNDKVFDANDFPKEELMDWIEHCTDSQVNKIVEFLKNLPKVVYADRVTCKKCTLPIDVYTEGIESFFT